MQITWRTVDEWRKAAGMETAEMARKAEIPERTIYMGLRKGSRLQAGTKACIRRVFPEKFDDKTGEARP